MFLDHQTLAKVYFKRRTNQSITASLNYGNGASTYGLWDGVGVSDAYLYQLLICDTSFYTGFFVSGYTNCYKHCDSWCGDRVSPYFRTASTRSYFGVAFNANGHRPVNKRLISVGLRWDIYGVFSRFFLDECLQLFWIMNVKIWINVWIKYQEI